MDTAAQGRRLQAEKEAAARTPQDERMERLLMEMSRKPSAEAQKADYSDAAPGLIQNAFSAQLDQSTAKILDLLGKATGTPIVVEAQVRGGTANGSYRNGVARIAADATNPYIVVGKHEITHRMQELAPKEYRAFRDYAVRVLSAENSGLVEQYQRNAAEQGENLTREQALDEIAADFTEMLLTDESRLEQFLTEATTQAESRTVAQRFFYAVREFLNKVRSVFNGERAKMDAAAREQFGVSLRQLEKAEQRWMKLVRASGNFINESVHSQGTHDTMYSLKDVQARFQRNFTGQVTSDEYIGLSNAEKAAISHALKTGYGQIEPDGNGGRVNTGRYCYLFDVTLSGGVKVTDVVDHNVLNIHKNDFDEEYEHGKQRNYQGVGAEFEGGRGRQGDRDYNFSPSTEARQSRAADRVVGTESRSNAGGNLQEIQGTGETQSGLKDEDLSLKGQSELMRQAAKDAQLAGMMNQGRKDAAKLRKAKEQTSEVRKKRAEVAKRMAELNKQYGTIKQGENPARDVSVPKRTSDDKKVSQTIRTVMEAQATIEGKAKARAFLLPLLCNYSAAAMVTPGSFVSLGLKPHLPIFHTSRQKQASTGSSLRSQ